MNLKKENEFLTNPFIFLGKYLERQEENYLTLCVCFLFNSSPVFRKEFLKLLSSLSLRFKSKYRISKVESFSAIPQLPFKKAKGKRGYFDIAICTKKKDGSSLLIAVIEAKVEASFGPNQLMKYRTSHRNAQLFVLTKYLTYESSIGFNKKAIPRFRWYDVYDVMKSAHKNAKGTEKSLIEEGVHMLISKGLSSPDSISLRTWNSLDKALLNKTTLSNNASEIFRGLAIVLDRLVLFRNSAWSELEEDGWKPFVNYYKGSEEDTGNYHNFQAGYYKYKTGAKNIRQKGLYIELYKDEKNYKQFVLSLIRYRRHVEDGFQSDSFNIRLDTTRKCFTLPFSDAFALIDYKMASFLRSFKRSNDSKPPK